MLLEKKGWAIYISLLLSPLCLRWVKLDGSHRLQSGLVRLSKRHCQGPLDLIQSLFFLYRHVHVRPRLSEAQRCFRIQQTQMTLVNFMLEIYFAKMETVVSLGSSVIISLLEADASFELQCLFEEFVKQIYNEKFNTVICHYLSIFLVLKDCVFVLA